MAEGDDANNTLDELATHFGPATEAEVLEVVGKWDTNELIEMGAEVATDRISTDCARTFGQGLKYWSSITDEQKDTLFWGLTDDTWRVAIWCAYRDEQVYKQFQSTGDDSAGKQSGRRAKASETRKQGRAVRTQIHLVLKGIVGGDAKLRDALDHAYGTAGTDEELATSLTNMQLLGASFLASAEPGIKVRVQRSGLSQAKLDVVAAMAAKVEADGKAGKATRDAGEVTQGMVDYWDGLTLVLYERIIDIFAAARAINRTVPNLYPIALRSYFRRSSRKPKGEGGGSGTSGSGSAA